ncbi:hypothetical protein [Sporosarcina sp. D27]|uniref:sunset domain-containing protein n=1 Tax=Sporosarcina sp. D27 TaxID=1382305 RepID=UPI00046E9B41|nr:hypothetical protein [Sporosarcina sp. D27]
MGIAAVGVAIVLLFMVCSRIWNIRVMKHSMVAFVAIGFSGLLLAGCGADQEQAQLYEKLETKNASVLEANQSLKTELSALQKEMDKLKSDFQGQTDEQSKIQETVQTLQKENTALTESITSLKTKNTELLASVGEKDKAIQQMKEQAAASKTAPSSTTSQSSTGGQASSQSAAAVSSQGQCDIKGSNSGIYHVPGSTYYSRTKNVARWFCSTAEAEKAGYRAPKQ